MNKKIWCFAEQGNIHKKNNIPCEDKVISGVKEGMRYIALADGAGSLKCCAVGAQCAVEAVVEYVSKNFERLLTESLSKTKYIILNHVLYSIKQKAGARNIKDFGSTLLFVGVKNDKCIVFHLGDGLIAAEYNTEFKVISAPMNGINKKYTYKRTHNNECVLF